MGLALHMVNNALQLVAHTQCSNFSCVCQNLVEKQGTSLDYPQSLQMAILHSGLETSPVRPASFASMAGTTASGHTSASGQPPPPRAGPPPPATALPYGGPTQAPPEFAAQAGRMIEQARQEASERVRIEAEHALAAQQQDHVNAVSHIEHGWRA